MPEFNFQGRNDTGQLIQGKRESVSIEEVSEQLQKEGIIPISIVEAKSQMNLIGLWQQKVKVDELLMFCRQIYTLTKAGIPIIYALTRLSEMVINSNFKTALLGMAQYVSSGQPLSAAMQHYPKIFPSILIQLVHVGEESGQLENTFLQASEYLELQSATRKRVTSVLRYPAFVLTAISIAIVIINILVIPNFAKLYSNFHVKLPLPTRILLDISLFMRHNWFVLLIALLVIIVAIRYYLKTPSGQMFWGKYQFRIPIVGDILKRIMLARFANIFATILRAGVPLLDGIRLMAGALDNAYASQCVTEMGDAIEHGESLTSSAMRTPLFTPLVLQMLSVGEETGSLDVMLDEAGKFYEREVDYEIKRLGERIEPVLIIALAAMVLILALGVFLPMWDISKLIQAGA